MNKIKGLYKIMCFVTDVGKKESIDIVPSSWVRWDKNKDCLTARFMTGPFTKKNWTH